MDGWISKTRKAYIRLNINKDFSMAQQGGVFLICAACAGY